MVPFDSLASNLPLDEIPLQVTTNVTAISNTLSASSDVLVILTLHEVCKLCLKMVLYMHIDAGVIPLQQMLCHVTFFKIKT